MTKLHEVDGRQLYRVKSEDRADKAGPSKLEDLSSDELAQIATQFLQDEPQFRAKLQHILNKMNDLALTARCLRRRPRARRPSSRSSR